MGQKRLESKEVILVLKSIFTLERHLESCLLARWNILLDGSVQLLSHVQLCDPMDCTTPGFPVYRQLLEFTQTHVYWVGDAIQPSHPLLSPSPPAFNLSQHQGLFKWVSSSQDLRLKVKTVTGSVMSDFVTTWAVACQAPLSMEFSRQEYWSGCHSLFQGIFPTQGLNSSLPHSRQILYHLSHQGSPF